MARGIVPKGGGRCAGEVWPGSHGSGREENGEWGKPLPECGRAGAGREGEGALGAGDCPQVCVGA